MKKMTLALVCLCSLATAQTDQQIENIATFNKLYGYVKYFHPSDEAAAVDWDRFAIYGAAEVEKCSDVESLTKKLIQLFGPIAPTVRIGPSNKVRSLSGLALTPPDTAGYKVVTWQYLGLGSGNPKNVYKSGRLNRKVLSSAQGMFGTITNVLEVQQYRNKKFRLEGSMRLIDGPGTGHFWARVDRAGKKMGFFDNMNDRPIASNQWRTYEVNGTFDSDAEKLAFGGFLLGAGKLMVDNLKISVLDGNEWQVIYSNSFEPDKVEAFPSGMSGTRDPEYKIAVTKAEASDGKKSVVIQGVVLEKQFEALFDNHVKPGQLLEKEIGSGLTAIIPRALYGNENHTWPRANAESFSELQKNLESVSLVPESGASTRVGGVIIAWNVFQHFYPYFDVVKVDWPGEFREAVRASYTNRSGYDQLETLRKLTAKLKDGHVNVFHSSASAQEGFAPPIKWEWIEDKLVVTKVVGSDVPLNRGDIVMGINGIPSHEYFEEVFSYISAATPGWLHYRAQTASLVGRKTSTLTLDVIDEQNKQKEVTLTRTVSMSDYYKLGDEAKESLRKVQEGIYYIDLTKAPMGEIKKSLPDLQNAKAIICDLRGYPNSNHEFITNLLHQNDTSKRWMQVPRIVYPDQENIESFLEMGWQMPALSPHIGARVFFLLDGSAISYAESFMGFIEHYDLATIIGQPSAGTNGNVNTFQIPGGYNIYWTGMKVIKHDGSQLHGVGILPDVYVNKTIRGIRENRDEFLEKAIEMATQLKQIKD